MQSSRLLTEETGRLHSSMYRMRDTAHSPVHCTGTVSVQRQSLGPKEERREVFQAFKS